MSYLASLTYLFATMTALHGALIFQNFRYSKRHKSTINLGHINDNQYLRALRLETSTAVQSLLKTTLIGSILLGLAWCGGFSWLASHTQTIVDILPLPYTKMAHDTLFLLALFVSISSVMILVDMIGFIHRNQKYGIKKLQQLGIAWLAFLPAIVVLISMIEVFAQSWWWIVPLTFFAAFMIYFTLEGRIFERIHTYKAVPDAADLRQSMEQLADRIRFSIRDIVTVPGSCQGENCLPKKVLIPGSGSKKHVIVYDDMLPILSAQHIGALFVREAYLSHRLHKGILALLTCFCISVILWIAQYLVNNAQLIHSLDLNQDHTSSVILVIYGVYSLINPLISAMIIHPYIRGSEQAADRYAAHMTSPDILREAILTPMPPHRQLLSYHPLYIIATKHTSPLVNRVKSCQLMNTELS